MFSNREELDFAESRYYRINQILLSTLTLWPYQQSKFAEIYHVLHIVIMLSFIFFQLTSFFTSQLTIDLILMVLSYAVPAHVYIIQYYSFYANPTKVKRMWNDIRNTWSTLKNETERDIMRQYSSSSELSTIVLLFGVISSLVLYAFTLFLPIILDVILPLNETRPRLSYAVTEYFVDERTYYYPMLCHWLIGLAVGALATLSTCTFQIVYIDHICGLLRIASYRIEHSIDEYVVRYPILGENRVTFQNIITAVDVHRKALECCEFVTNMFTSSLFLIVITGVISLSLNLFRLLNTIISSKYIYEMISSLVFVLLHFAFMFLANYYGQKVTDHNNEIFNTTYNLRWYMAPVRIQKLLLFIMKGTTKAYVFNIGHLIMASVEGFSKISSMSISYFTMIYSLQL